MKAYRNADKSWEKQTVFDLENACQVTVEYNSQYGDFISCIEDKEGRWYCSDGVGRLPERFNWALTWVEPYIKEWADTQWIVPRFVRCHGKCPW